MDDAAKSILLILVGLGIVWALLGGPARTATNQGIFIKPPSPLDSGEVYGWTTFKQIFGIAQPVPAQNLTAEERIKLELEQAEQEALTIQKRLTEIEEEENTSIFAGKIEIYKCSGSSADVNKEYVELRVANSVIEKILISGWKLKSGMTGIDASLGKATSLPYTSQSNTESAVFVTGKDKIIISSGRSPIGISFLVNKCSGYLEQFQDFTPSLDKKCPLLEDEDLPLTGPNAFNDDCLDYIENISRCETVTGNLPLTMQPECQAFIIENAYHNACLDNYRHDSDFYQQEWRLFLKRDTELWKSKREVVELRDNDGKLVDVCVY